MASSKEAAKPHRRKRGSASTNSLAHASSQSTQRASSTAKPTYSSSSEARNLRSTELAPAAKQGGTRGAERTAPSRASGATRASYSSSTRSDHLSAGSRIPYQDRTASSAKSRPSSNQTRFADGKSVAGTPRHSSRLSSSGSPKNGNAANVFSHQQLKSESNTGGSSASDKMRSVLPSVNPIGAVAGLFARKQKGSEGFLPSSSFQMGSLTQFNASMPRAKHPISFKKILLFSLPLVLVLGLVFGSVADAKLHEGKIYEGVSIGSVDVSGLTAQQAETLLVMRYGPGIAQNSIKVYANEEAQYKEVDELESAQEEALAEQQDYEEAQETVDSWDLTANSLQASFDTEEYADQAFAVGRTDGGFFTRLGSRFFGHELPLHLDFNKDRLDSLLTQIETTAGEPLVDSGIEIEEGAAVAREGSDGYCIDEADFMHDIESILLAAPTADPQTYIPSITFQEQRIALEDAQELADYLNAAFARQIQFNYDEVQWVPEASELLSWVKTEVVENEKGKGYHLVAYLDDSLAKPELLAKLKNEESEEGLMVSMEKAGSNVFVLTNGVGKIPLVDDAVQNLNEVLFPENHRWSSKPDPEGLAVYVQSASMPKRISADEALESGIIGLISTYTTEFTVKEGTENRNHNIQLASALINDSIAKSNGGEWSFNETAGECNEERGFLGAGAIISGEYSDAVGGGICQVATTVFNAVYESGFPVVERSNHSLYISSYPEGRDAAVSYPELDFVWQNDSSNDVLLRTEYTEGSLTVSLYGISPEYSVESEVGAWVAGDEFERRTKSDPSLAPGMSYIKTQGADGRSITVFRTVKDKLGEVIREDTFYSSYEPVDEITLVGEYE